MRRRAGSRLSKVVLAGIGLDQRDEFLDRLRRYLWVDAQHVWRSGHQRHRGEILERIVRHPGIEAWVHYEPGARNKDRITVCSSLGSLRGPSVAAAARNIFDVELLAKVF